MKDRFTNGFVAGFSGGIIMNIFNYFSYYILNFTKVRFLDYAAVFIYGEKTNSLIGMVFAQIIQLFFAGFLGVIFAYLITFISSKNFLLKGLIFGTMSWFFIYAVGLLFKLPLLEKISIETAISNFIGSLIYGISTSYFLKLLNDNKMIS